MPLGRRHYLTQRYRPAGPGRPSPVSVIRSRRPVRAMSGLYGRRMAHGGFFKSLFKGVSKVVKSVTRIPVIGTVAKAAVSSLPIIGQVRTAVEVFKHKTPVGVAASPVGGTPTPAQALNMATNPPRAPRSRRAPRKKARKAKAKKTRKAKGKGGGSAKQRAARARFAAAARKGKIKKGSRL